MIEGIGILNKTEIMVMGNKKIYVVTRGCYSDYHIESIFSNREAAEKYCALHWDVDGDEPNIEEWDLEDGSDIQCTVHYGLAFYAGKKGERITGWDMVLSNTPIQSDIGIGRKHGAWFIPGLTGVIPVSKYITDKDEAYKIIYDVIAKWKAEQEHV